VGLPNPWVAFNGYWPEKSAAFQTTTFKELEAWTVLARLPRAHTGILVIASAGNTGAAFVRACSMNGIRCLVIVPETGLDALQFSEPVHPCVRIVSLGGFTDYFDAITLANRVAALDGFFAEGGVRNVARVDGLGTTMLSAVEAIGRLPHYYLQAIGSGAGGIGVYETARRVVADGRFGERLPRLLLSQNMPFVPIYLSWKAGRRALVEIDAGDGKKQIQQIAAQCCRTAGPPTPSAAECTTSSPRPGATCSPPITSRSCTPVAFATLLKAARYGPIERTAIALLNITGGGRCRQRLDRTLVPARPALSLNERDLAQEATLDRIVDLFG
jgi:cysteate synthase